MANSTIVSIMRTSNYRRVTIRDSDPDSSSLQFTFVARVDGNGARRSWRLSRPAKIGEQQLGLLANFIFLQGPMPFV